MNKNTFGDTHEAIILAEILDTHSTYRRRVSSMLNEHNNVNNSLIKSNLFNHLKKSFLRTTLERFKTKASNLDIKEVETFTKNVIKQQYRKALVKI